MGCDGGGSGGDGECGGVVVNADTHALRTLSAGDSRVCKRKRLP
jgi:hypothetical protein